MLLCLVGSQVTYIRIRQPGPETIVSQSDDEVGRMLLDKLNRRLYQLEMDQPLSPLSDDELVCGRR